MTHPNELPTDQERWTPTPLQPVSVLYREYYPQLLNFARRFHPADEAADVVHHTVMRFMQRLQRGTIHDDPARRETALFTLLRDVSREWHRTGRRRVGLLGAFRALTRTSEPEPTTPQRSELVARVDASLRSMPRCWANAFEMGYDDTITFATMAELLGVSEGTARSYYSRACGRLRDDLLAVGIAPDWFQEDATS